MMSSNILAHENDSLVVWVLCAPWKKTKMTPVHTNSRPVLLECNSTLHPCPWEVVLSGFAVANFQVSLNSSSVEGMKWTCFRSEQLDYWKIMCTKNIAVTKLRYSLAKAMREIK